MSDLNCIIIDDNELDRLMVESLVRKFTFLSISGIYSNVNEALEHLNKGNIDVLFTDIDMPEISGLELRHRMKNIPVCIFITSYAEYAVESFDADALDFLVKPVNLERFTRTANRIREYMDLKLKATKPEFDNESVFIKEGYGQVKIVINDILYIEALKDFTKIVTTNKQYCVSVPFGNLLKENAFGIFIRVHRSFAIQKKSIFKILSQKIELENGVSIPIGRSYKVDLNLD
jgi:two-component system, LytTR family, response regulator